MTKQAATDIWTAMSPMERFEIMQAVGYMKSITRRQRACITEIQRRG